jgi:hypothetical protein
MKAIEKSGWDRQQRALRKPENAILKPQRAWIAEAPRAGAAHNS